MDEHPPDATDVCIRGGCGLVAGGVIAFFFLLRWIVPFTGTFWLAVLVGAVIFALLAIYFGDAAWHTAIHWLGGLWPW